MEKYFIADNFIQLAKRSLTNYILELTLHLKQKNWMLTLLLLNKLKSHTHFWFSASQITWSGLLL